MTDKAKGEAFVKLPRGLLESAAWRALGINARRFIEFLMIEHMRHGGKANGALLAPRQQLKGFGIGARHVSAAIEEAENLGFVDCRRGVGRRPSVYALTWLRMGDDSAPSNRWLTVMTSEGKSLQMVSEGIPLGYPKGSHKARSGIRREVTKPQNKGIRRDTPLKKASLPQENSVRIYQEEASREEASGGLLSCPGVSRTAAGSRPATSSLNLAKTDAPNTMPATQFTSGGEVSK